MPRTFGAQGVLATVRNVYGTGERVVQSIVAQAPPRKAITPQRHRARKRLTWPALFLPTLFLSAIATPAIPTTTIGSLQAVGLPVPALWQFRYWYC